MYIHMYNFGEQRARTHARTHAESFSVFRSILEPTCNFSLLYTVIKISSISYPYQCLFAHSAQKGMGREKIGEVLKEGNTDVTVAKLVLTRSDTM